MITKERLEELIKEEKGCYILANAYTIGYIHLNKRYEPIIKTNEDGYNLWVFTSNEYDFRDCINDYNLFETKEEAEWYLEFGNITRTETLELPSWEEVQEMLKVDCNECQIVEKYNIKLYLEVNRYIPIQIKLFVDYGTYYEKFNWNLSKENYIEACRMAKNLFLGEEV